MNIKLLTFFLFRYQVNKWLDGSTGTGFVELKGKQEAKEKVPPKPQKNEPEQSKKNVFD